MLILLAVVLLLFGSTRLPGVAQALGQSMRIFKREVKQMHEDPSAITPAVSPAAAVPAAAPMPQSAPVPAAAPMPQSAPVPPSAPAPQSASPFAGSAQQQIDDLQRQLQDLQRQQAAAAGTGATAANVTAGGPPPEAQRTPAV